MPIMNDFVGLVSDTSIKKGPLSDGLNGKAKDDFCYLLGQSGLASRKEIEHIVVSGANGLPDTECVIVGVDEKNTIAEVPASELTFKEIAKLVVVVYKQDAVAGVYVWNVDDSVLKPKLFSRFKIDKKTGNLKIKSDKIEKCADNKFGVAYKDYITRGV